MASGLALRNLLRRTKTTAIIGAIQGVTRPENLRMVNLLDIHVEPITAGVAQEFDRIAMVDVQPHYFGGLIDRVDLVIDHHPEQPGYSAVFKDIRADYGSTSTILTEHLRAVDVNISERTATAMLYAIKSDTLFFNRQTNRVDLEAFSFLYPLADAALIRKMEGRGNHARAARLRARARSQRACCASRCSARSSARRRARTSSPTSPTSSCSSKTSSGRSSPASSTTRSSCPCGTWATRGTPASSCKRCFADIGSAGGHRAMAKAVVPMRRVPAEVRRSVAATDLTARIAGHGGAVPPRARRAEKKK